LRHTKGLGPRRAVRLLRAYGGAYAAVSAALGNPAAWVEDGLVPADLARRFAAESWRDEARREWDRIRAKDFRVLLYSDPAYPALLREIPDAPLLLYYQGDLGLLRGPNVAVVGARNCTAEGMAVASWLSRDLAKAGVTVISGMAKGIDRVAHLAALEEAGGSIAVLGTGIDVVYPPINADLYAHLAERGLLIAEFMPGSEPAPARFPIRNRLISGLSQGVLVVEAAAGSGSLITARLALEQDRDVFAVPGHTMAAVSEGCRELIRRGAKAVFRADDILTELAPLLTLEARKALSARQQADAAERPRPARKRGRDLSTSLLEQASPVLPESPLPWKARASRPTSRPQAPAPLPLPDTADKAATPPAPRPDLPPDLTEDERRILSVLSEEKKHIDLIVRDLGMDVSKLSSHLTLLEVRGIIRSAPGMFYYF
jgi:DNA processing protein